MESDRVRMRRPDEGSISPSSNAKQHRLSASAGGDERSILRSMASNISQEVVMTTWQVVTEFLGSPWVRLVVFVLAVFFTAPLYYGWQQYSLMLGRSGAYSWLCDVSDSPIDDVYDCAAQEKAIGRLYSIAAGCEYASAAWGGIFLDTLGPRISGLIGELGWVLGTAMIMISSQSLQLYIPGMIVLGSSVNVVMFPSLVTIESWPQWRGLMVGVALAASTAATLIPPVMWSLWDANPTWSFLGIWSVYIAAIWLPMTVLYVIALPGARDYQKILKVQRKEMLALKAKTQTQEDTADQHSMTNGGGTPIRGGSVNGPDALTVNAPPASIVSSTDDAHMMVVREATWGEFLRNILTIDMIVMAIYFFIMMAMYAYYPTVVRTAISPRISDFVGWFQPTQAIWSLLIGLLSDVFRTPWVMTMMCLMLGVVFLISTLADSMNNWHWVAATVLTISQCAIFEVKFTYVSEMFDPYHYGKLVGFLGVVGGLGTFLNIPIANSTAYNTVFISYTCLMPLLIALAVWLGLRQKRGHTYKTLPDTEPQQPLVLNVDKSVVDERV